MIEKTYKLNAQHLAFQRNTFLALTLILVVAVMVLSIALSMKGERIVVVPQMLSEKVWVKGSRVSASYLKEQAQIVSMLYLSKTPSSSIEQGMSLLKITAPSFYGHLKRKLREEVKILEEQGASYVFIPLKTTVNESSMRVISEGERSTYVLGKVLSTVKEKYTYQFIFNGTNLLLSGVVREELKGA